MTGEMPKVCREVAKWRGDYVAHSNVYEHHGAWYGEWVSQDDGTELFMHWPAYHLSDAWTFRLLSSLPNGYGLVNGERHDDVITHRDGAYGGYDVVSIVGREDGREAVLHAAHRFTKNGRPPRKEADRDSLMKQQQDRAEGWLNRRDP